MGETLAAGAAGDRSARQRSFLFLALVLLAVQAVWLWGFRERLDVSIGDEVFYFRRGIGLARLEPGAFDLAYSPLYSAVYAVLGSLPSSALAPDFMFWLCAAAAPVALLWALLPLVPAPAALLAATWWGASPLVLQFDRVNVGADTTVYLFGAILGCLAIGAFARQRWLVGTICLATVATNRMECTPWLLLHGLVLVALSWSPRLRSLRVPGLVALAIGCALAVLLALHAGTREKTWVTFRQHYTYNATERELVREWERRGGELEPEFVQKAVAALEGAFSRSEQRVARDFPGATSVLEASYVNPASFTEHLAHNLEGSSTQIETLAAGSFSFAPAVRRFILWGTLGLSALGVVASLVARRSAFAGGPIVWVALVTSVAVVPPSLLARARPELILPIAPLVLALAATLASAGARAFIPSGVLAPSAGVLASALCALLLAVLTPNPYGVSQPVLQHRAAVELVRRAVPGGATLLGAYTGQYSILALREDLRTVDVRASPEMPEPVPFSSVLERERPDYVLVTPALLGCEARYHGIERALDEADWQLVDAEGKASLFLKPRRIGR